MLVFFVDECFERFGSYDFQKNVHLIKPFEEIIKINKKIALLENTSTKKRSTRSSLYYDGYGSYDCPKIFLPIKPLKEVEFFFFFKCSSREFDNEENEHRVKCILWRVR